MHIILSAFSKLRRTFHDEDHYLLPKRHKRRIRETIKAQKSKTITKGNNNCKNLSSETNAIINFLHKDTNN